MTKENALAVLREAKNGEGRRAFSDSQLDEYVSEAEHQDGLGYWKQFRDPDSLVEDVRLYFECSAAMKDGPGGEA